MFNKLVSVALLVVVTFVLSSCAPTLSGLQDTEATKARPTNLPQPDAVEQSDSSMRFIALQTEIGLNDARSGYLDSSDDQPWDTYVIRNVSRGTRVIVELSGPSNADFDLYVWSDGAWVAGCSTSVGCTYSSNERVEFTTSSSTDVWIFPYAYSGSGQYTLKTISQSDESGLKLPLPGGKSWLLITEAITGYTIWGTVHKLHKNKNALDFDDISQNISGGPNKESNVLVLASGSGIVLEAGGTGENTWDKEKGACKPLKQGESSTKNLGYYVIIQHSNNLRTLYAHLASWPMVSKGQSVLQGRVLGYIGNTGCSSGSHLHFEILPSSAAGIKIEGLSLESYKVGTTQNYRYYPSTNSPRW